MVLRRYAPSDHETVRALHVNGLAQFGADAGLGPWDADIDRIPEVYLDNHGEFLVGEIGGAVVAIGGLRRVDQHVAEIKRMRVRLDYQRQGLGGELLRALERRAQELGYRTLRLDTTVQQIPAQKLYERNGYLRVGSAVLGGYQCILYSKELTL